MLYNINIELFYIVILISGIMCGYMVADFPKEFLNLFTTPIGQFLTIFTIFFTIRRDLKIKIKISSIIKLKSFGTSNEILSKFSNLI